MNLLTAVAALAGAVTGTAGLVLGVVNYLRDSPRVLVKLHWDWKIMHDPRRDPNKLWGLVEVANVGRRPVFVSHASLRLPRGYDGNYELLLEGLAGAELREGCRPVTWTIDQDGLSKYAKDWRKIRAVVFDSAEQAYRSAKPDRSKPPSWARAK